MARAPLPDHCPPEQEGNGSCHVLVRLWAGVVVGASPGGPSYVTEEPTSS